MADLVYKAHRDEGGHKYEPDINYLHNGKYKDMKGNKNYYEMQNYQLNRGGKTNPFLTNRSLCAYYQ